MSIGQPHSSDFLSIGLAPYSEGTCQDVLARLTDGLSWASGGPTYSPPSKSAIFPAQARLGAAAEPLQGLFERVAKPNGGNQK